MQNCGVSKPRILGGRAKGRTLITPKEGTRPSPAKLRAAVFDILQNREPGTFLDLFAGSGGVGLEASSRGWDVTLVELAKPACRVIHQNALALRLEAKVIQDDALQFAAQNPDAFDCVFAAPPYPLDLSSVFNQILASQPQVEGGVVLLQHPTQFDLATECHDELMGRPVKRYRYGSNTLTRVG